MSDTQMIYIICGVAAVVLIVFIVYRIAIRFGKSQLDSDIDFMEGVDFEDVIRTAVSLGGDCDTLTAIAGSIAEAYYGIPADLKDECYQRLDEDLSRVLEEFEGV